jgi:hypothetical protein
LNAFGPVRLSTIPTTHAKLCDISLASRYHRVAITEAAPDISHFISSIPVSDLIWRPPASNTTHFPTKT